jgi:asparagine synthase (glutamine-hydrolysing)
MPGIVGFAGKSGLEDNQKFLHDMAQALDSGSRYKVDLFTREKMGLGRVGLGIVNSDPQPIWNEDQSLCIVMEGELYDYAQQKERLIHLGHRFQHHNDAEFVLHLFEEDGDGFAEKLNGAFVAAIWDKNYQTLYVVNDRLGLYPLYYALNNGALLFASGVRSLLVDPTLPRDIDHLAVGQFLTFDHLLDDRTLLESVRLLPQASLLEFGDGRLEIKRYWDINYPQDYPLRSEQDYMDEFSYLIRQAVSRQAPGDLTAGILLSGGLDSRLLLAHLVNEKAGQTLRSFTWGIPGCDDARYAKELANKVASQHHFFELKPDWLLDKAEQAVRITDGMGNLVNLHAYATLDSEAELANVIYKGFLGDAMFGFGIRHQFWASYDEPTRLKAHYQVHSDQGVITFNQQEQYDSFSEGFKNKIGSSILDSYIAGMDDSRSKILASQRLYYDYRQRVPRMTLKGVEVVRTRAMVRLPFCDNDLVEFSIRVPPGLLYERRLMKNSFIREFPKLAQIPVTDSGLPLMLCMRDLTRRASQMMWWRLQSTRFKDIAGPMRRPYKDYNSWFRTNLRGWVEKTLLNPSALQRGYLKPESMRKIVSEHMAGENHTVKLGALLSLELWHKQFVD